MAMRETERSLRWYFWVAGVIAVVTGCRNLSSTWDMIPDDERWRFMLAVPSFARVAFGGAFVVAGSKLKEALASDPTWIRRLLVLVGVAQVAELALIWWVFHDMLGSVGSMVIGSVATSSLIGVAITVYLHYNLVRLSRETKARLPSVFE